MPTIRPRGGKFQVQVRIKRGGLIVHQESATFASRKQAELWGLSLERKLERDGVESRPAELSSVSAVMDLHEALLRSLHPGEQSDSNRAAGVRGSWTSLQLIKSAPFAHKPIGHVSVSDITTWIKSITNLSPATKLHILMTMRAAYRSASSMHGIPADVDVVGTATNQLRRLKVAGNSQARDQRVTNEQIERLVAGAAQRNSKVPMDTIIRLAVALPRRLNELLTMTWAGYSGNTMQLLDTKSPGAVRRDEIVPVPPAAQALINTLARPDARILPYNPKYVSNAFAAAADAAGLPEIHFHDLRHEGISRLFAAGLNIPEVSLISGHTSWATLRRYTHLKPSDVLEKLRAGTQTDQKAPA